MGKLRGSSTLLKLTCSEWTIRLRSHDGTSSIYLSRNGKLDLFSIIVASEYLCFRIDECKKEVRVMCHLGMQLWDAISVFEQMIQLSKEKIIEFTCIPKSIWLLLLQKVELAQAFSAEIMSTNSNKHKVRNKIIQITYPEVYWHRREMNHLI